MSPVTFILTLLQEALERSLFLYRICTLPKEKDSTVLLARRASMGTRPASLPALPRQLGGPALLQDGQLHSRRKSSPSSQQSAYQDPGINPISPCVHCQTVLSRQTLLRTSGGGAVDSYVAQGPSQLQALSTEAAVCMATST